MNFRSVIFFGFACLSAGVVSAAETGNRSFVERVRPENYFAVEKLFPETFSSANELVILRTKAAKPVSVLTVRQAETRDGYVLVQQFASATAPDGWLKISEDLDRATAQQVLRAVEIRLHRQVTLSKFKRVVSKTDSDLWLYQRTSDDQIAAGVIAMEDTLENPAASGFIDDFLGALQDLIGKEGAERAATLEKIDRMATAIISRDGALVR
jgi:hypothetical protein